MRVSFSPETNFDYPNNNIHYKKIRFSKENNCFRNKYYVSFKYIDWRCKSVKHKNYRLKNKKDYLNYKNKLNDIYNK
jgi:hypothetical protein